MKDNKIDELLNAYMDGQLSERRRTEVKRLLKHDTDIAARLKELQKVKNLLAAVPHAQAPQELVENIKNTLERRTLVGAATAAEDYDQTEGQKHLFWRQVISAAAIIVLAVGLAAVVYTIVAPQPQSDHPVLSRNWIEEEIPAGRETPVLKTALDQAAPEGGPRAPAKAKDKPGQTHLTAQLNLTTETFEGVDAYVKRSIVDQGIMLIELSVTEPRNGLYNVRCSRDQMDRFLSDLAAIWDKFDTATLYVRSDRTGREVTVPDVTAKQIGLIIDERDPETSLRLAKNLASLNAMTRNLPTSDLALEPSFDSMPVPKPVLTSPQETPKKETGREESDTVYLVIRIESTD